MKLFRSPEVSFFKADPAAMTQKTRKALFARGLDSGLVEKIDRNSHTVAQLGVMSRGILENFYTPDEAASIIGKIKRPEIPERTVEAILQQSGCCCCFCADGNSSRPYQLHHATPYAETQDHSEGNLLLLCPTHHATIHETNWDRTEQIRIRDSWYALRNLAADIERKGLGFPYGTFEWMDFRPIPDWGDLVEISPLSPSTAEASCPDSFAARGEAFLRENRCVTVIGGSGDGKSSYALGLAGRFARIANARVFRYRQHSRNANSMREISEVILACATPSVLIVDDANAWAPIDAIVKLVELAALSPATYLILTVSSDDTGTAESISRPNGAYQLIDWSVLKDSVLRNILAHEDAIVERLAKLPTQNAHRVGYGQLDRRLRAAASEAANSASTVYDFIFKLRNPSAGARQFAVEFTNTEAQHQPLLVAAIEQIAGFEQPVEAAEVVEICRTLIPRNGVAAPSEKWVNAVFRRAVNRRCGVESRGAFKTVHRRWAADFIDECLQLPSAAIDARALLLREFTSKPVKPVRLLRLWSWLVHRPAGEEFIQDWFRNLPPPDRIDLAGCCCADGILNASSFVNSVNYLLAGAGWKEIVRETFEPHEPRLIEMITTATAADWRWLQTLMSAVCRSVPGLARRILAAWTPAQAAELINRSPVAVFAHVNCFLAGVVLPLEPQWAIGVGRKLSWDAIRLNLGAVDPGSLSDISEAADLLANCRVRLMRSMVRDFFHALRRVVADVAIEDLCGDIPCTHLWMMIGIFDEDARRAFSAINTKRWAAEISSGPPRLWCKLSDVSYLFDACNSSIIAETLAQCDRALFLTAIQRFALRYRFEFRVLLHQIATINEAQRTELIAVLQPLVETIVADKEDESVRVLEAFHRINPAATESLAQWHSIEISPGKFDSAQPVFEEMRKRRTARDIEDGDYDTELFFYD